MCLGQTPLSWASEKGHLGIVEHLIEHKANIEAKNNDGMFLDSASAIVFSLCVLARMWFVDADVWC